MIFLSMTIVKVIAVQIEGLLAASGAGVEEPDHESFWVNNGGDKRTTVCTALAM